MNNLRNMSVTWKLAGVALVTALVVGVYVVMFYAIQRQNKASAEAISEAETLLQNFQETSKIKKLLDETAPARAQLDSYVVTEETAVTLFETLEENAQATGVTFEIVSANINDSFTLQIQATGVFSDVYSFFALLEYLPFGVRIDRMEMRVVEDSDHHETDIKAPVWQGSAGVTVTSFISRR